MVSPSKCYSQDTTALDLHSPSRSTSESLSIVLWFPNSEPTELSDVGKMVIRRSPRLNCNSSTEREGTKSSRAKRLLMLKNGCSVRRSPRFTPVVGNFNNVSSVPVTGKFGSRKRKSSSSIFKKESLDSERLTKFKEIAMTANGMDLETVSERRLQDGANRKVESDTLSSSFKRVRRSPRFNKAMENDGEEDLEKSKEVQKKFKALKNPSIRTPRLSGIVENGHVETEKVTTAEVHKNSIEIYLSDSDEQMADKNILNSVECSYTKSSNGDILMQDASGNGRLTSGKRVTRTTNHKKRERSSGFFIGDPISCKEAEERWQWRYDLKSRGQSSEDDEDKIVANVEYHYSQANVDGNTFSLGDFAYIKGEGVDKYVGKIVEFFMTTDEESYFRVQWFYRATDTVMKQQANYHDTRRLFYSTVMNDNPIDCLISKLTVLQGSPMAGLKPDSLKYDFYFDMEYCIDYSTFRTLRNFKSSDHKLECCDDFLPMESTESLPEDKLLRKELYVLDLYSGCGGMSTGLSLGAKISGVDVLTKWAVDQNMAACESLKLNHPHTQVRNDAAGDFLLLLKEWEKLCKCYVFSNDQTTETSESSSSSDDDSESEYEVEKLLDICYGDPDETGEYGLKFKVHWKGYSSNEDTWEPAEGLSNCKDAIRKFVTSGFKTKILPLPGDVGVICGGPPCQGISGYNRFRNVDSPLTDEKNQQIIVFMDIVEYLKPDFVLMENVVDILRMDKGSLGRYALSRLVHMRYQARLGIMTAGCYGLSQFRSRVFVWGANPNMNLPSFPLPTHDVIVKYGLPLEFERNVVAYSEGQPRNLEKATVLKDAISDLPHVSYNEVRETMAYESLPETDFQRYIRSTKHNMTGSATDNCTNRKMLLHDHRPIYMSEDDYIRVCHIPKKKGANFRALPGLIVKNDNSVCRDPSMKPVILPSGKPLVPNYVFTFMQGKSKRPFARIWWDETVPTVLTFPTCHSQALLHPEQDRMLTIRESARLQGFPDYFRFCGTVKERYCQIGNAVAVSVSRALGYSLGIAFRGVASDEHLIKLPQNFSHSAYLQLRETIPH